jgi:Skp family chaperone for outer membrane proteins
MKKLMQIALLFLGLAGFGLAGLAAEQRIAIFNLRKAFESYYKTKLSDAALQKEVSDVEKERATMIEDARAHEAEWRKLYDKANDQAVSADEREKGRQAASQKYAELESDKKSIEEFDRTANARITEKRNLRRDELVKEILGVVTAHAKTAGYAMVLDPSGNSVNMVPVVLYTNGQDDLTDVIIKELNSAAPPDLLLDTNAPPALSSTNVTNPPTAPK